MVDTALSTLSMSSIGSQPTADRRPEVPVPPASYFWFPLEHTVQDSRSCDCPVGTNVAIGGENKDGPSNIGVC